MKIENSSELIKDVIATEHRWVQAHRDMDIDVIADILSDRYRQIKTNGSVIRKNQLLDSYQSGERMWEIAESSEYDVQILGDTAFLTGKWRGKGINTGEAFDYTARFLALYVLENGNWKLIFDISIPTDESQ